MRRTIVNKNTEFGANVSLFRDEDEDCIRCELRIALPSGSVFIFLNQEEVDDMIQQITENWYI